MVKFSWLKGRNCYIVFMFQPLEIIILFIRKKHFEVQIILYE